jgi:hypothetical protein
MLGAFKKFLAGQGLADDWSQVAAWAQAQGFSFKKAREPGGFVVGSAPGGRNWRLEFGASQRDYIHGRELRVRGELGLPADMQMLVMSHSLVEVLERKTFDAFTESNQTQIDTSTPDEVRWLVMFQRLNLSTAKALKPLFVAVSASSTHGNAWIEGPLAAQLERASMRLMGARPPFVLMTQRGNLYLRMQAPDVDEQLLTELLTLFETAATAALRAAGGRAGEPGTPSGPGGGRWGDSTGPGLRR